METFIKNAKAKGFSDAQIQAFLAKKQQETPQPTQTAQPQGGLASNLGSGALSLISSLLKPFITTGKNIGTAATVLPQAALASLAEKSNPQAAAQIASPDIFGTQSRAQQMQKDPEAALAEQGRANLGLLSYAVPFGKGANILTKAILPGATAGALQGASEENATPESVIGSGILGAGTGAAVHGIGKILGFGQKGLTKGGENLIQSQYNLPRSAANSTKIADTVSQLADYGITDINKVSEAASKVTGDTGAITKVTREAAMKAKPVNVDGVLNVARQLADDPSMAIGQDKKFYDFVKKGIQSLYNTTGSDAAASQVGAPDKVFDFIKTLEKQASSIGRGRPSYMISESEKALQRAYMSLADDLSERLFTESGANVNVAQLVKDPAFLAKLAEVSPKLAEQASKVTKLSELRSLAAPFVRGSIASDITSTGANLATDTAAGAVKGVGKLVQNPLNLLAVPLGTNKVNSTIGSAMRTLGNASGPQLGRQTASALTSGAIGTVRNLTGQTGQEQNSQEYSAEPLDLTSDATVTPEKKASIMDNPKVQAVLASPNVSKSTKNLFLAEFIKEQTTTKAAGTASERKQSLLANSGLRALKEIEAEVNKDPSILAKQLVPKQFFSRTFQSAMFKAADAIIRMRSGARATNEEIQAYKENVLPAFGDDGATIRFKLQQLKQDFQEASLTPATD